ncbi:hypothetical protein [Aliikangiella coralliicola]|uniref:hypothetical protein n=1 Tax=Aliikangiella coralliicola TaxID=2592383 RepID=UPI00143D3522|nr:hypothetical protein [Aliikangiella coralliicola]
MIYDIGQKPGKGIYQCTSCARILITLENDGDRLPPCETCGSGPGVKYLKIG